MTQLSKTAPSQAMYKPVGNRKFRNVNGLDAQTAFYGFYVRLDGEAREQFREVKRRLAIALGNDPSNPMVFDFLLQQFLTPKGNRNG